MNETFRERLMVMNRIAFVVAGLIVITCGKLDAQDAPADKPVALPASNAGAIADSSVGKLDGAQGVSLFDGKTFAGWEGDTDSVWRIEDGAIVAGSLEKEQPKNNFLATTREFKNFELTLKWKLEGNKGFVNGGVQFWSKRVPNGPEVCGFQADLGAGYDGSLCDESRRPQNVLVKTTKETLAKACKPLGEWNDYRIRGEGRHIQIWLNGVQTVDYTEADESIPLTGVIALQIHGNATSLVRYKDISIKELPEAK